MRSNRYDLFHHPAGAPVAAGLTVRVTAVSDGGLHLDYLLNADPRSIRWPVAALPGPADELWRNTCFEAFVAFGEETGYREFNFSPSGQWADYAFCDYRTRGMDETGGPEPTIAFEQSGNGAKLDARIPAGRLPAKRNGGMLLLGLSAVIESADGAFSWWALRHCSAEPDFHRRDTFAARLDWSP